MAPDGVESTVPTEIPQIQITAPTPAHVQNNAAHFGRHLADARRTQRSLRAKSNIHTPSDAEESEADRSPGSILPQIAQNTGTSSPHDDMDVLSARFQELYGAGYTDEKILDTDSDKIVVPPDSEKMPDTDRNKMVPADSGMILDTYSDMMMSTDDDKIAAGPASWISRAGQEQTISEKAAAITIRLLNDHAAGVASPLASVMSSARRLVTESAGRYISAALDKAKGDLAREAATDAVNENAQDDTSVRSGIRIFRIDNNLPDKIFQSLLHPTLPGHQTDLRRLADQAALDASASLTAKLVDTFGLWPSAINDMLQVKIEARVENPETLNILAHHVVASALRTIAGAATDDQASNAVAAKLSDVVFLDTILLDLGNILDTTAQQAATETAKALYAEGAVINAMKNAASAQAKQSLRTEMAPRLLAWVDENPPAPATSSSPARPTSRRVSVSPSPTSWPDQPPRYEDLTPIGPLPNQNAVFGPQELENRGRHASPRAGNFGATILLQPMTNVAGSQNRLSSPRGNRFQPSPSPPGRLSQAHAGPGYRLQQTSLPSFETMPQTPGSFLNTESAVNSRTRSAVAEPSGVTSSEAPAVEGLLRQVFEDWIPSGAPTFAENVKLLDGPTFEAFYRQSRGEAGNVTTINTFTTTASDGTVRIWVREGFEDEHTLAYSLLHAYVSPGFRRLAGNCIVNQRGGNSNLNSGIVHFMVSQLTDPAVAGRRDAEIAGQIYEIMGDKKCKRAVFLGDPAALREFRRLAAEARDVVVHADAG